MRHTIFNDKHTGSHTFLCIQTYKHTCAHAFALTYIVKAPPPPLFFFVFMHGDMNMYIEKKVIHIYIFL